MPEAVSPAATDVPDDVPTPPDGGATRLADEMMAMFSDPEPAQPTEDEPKAEPPAQTTAELDPSPVQDGLEVSERPSAEINPDDELLQDPSMTAEEESKRRWFNR
jgi:hypothetical protein